MGKHKKQTAVSSVAQIERQHDLRTACAVLHSLTFLLKHYQNDLGDDSGHCWYGLGVVLENIHQSIEGAIEASESSK